MAQMIPDAMPPGKSIGESRLFSRLQVLPDDCIVYYEPIVGDRYPDFIVIIPDRGLLVIEVKGWPAYQILGGDSHTVRLRSRGSEPEATATNPIRQAKDYMHRLMDTCRRHRAGQVLLNPDGPHKGKFVFPLGYCAVLTQVTDEQLRTHPAGDLRSILPEEHVVDGEEADAWGSFTAGQLKERLSAFFDPAWAFPALTPSQQAALRTVLHPEVLVPPTPADLAKIGDMAKQVALLADDQKSVSMGLKALDLEQERYARSLGSGHRLLFGVAGSGKTVVVVSRAKYLSEARPSGAILVLCFNVALRTYLRAILHGLRNVDVYTFHGWGHHNKVQRQPEESPESFGTRFQEVLESGLGDAGKYDAVLIDEAQDFDPSWFACAKAAMKEPMTGDLLIVGDGSQTSYERRATSWKSLGINAVGRTKILRRNYRNSRPILEAAAAFAGSVTSGDIPGTVSDPKDSGFESPIQPLLVRRANRLDEVAAVGELVEGLLAGKLRGNEFEPLAASDIGLLYREHDACIPHLIDRLSKLAPVLWLSEKSDGRDPRQLVLEPGIKLQTIHAAKGLEYRGVILLFADQLGSRGTDLDRERRLLYVALTRARDMLGVTCSIAPGTEPRGLLASLLATPGMRLE